MDEGVGALTRICIICKKHIPNDANVCPHCGHDYRPAMSGQAWEERRTPLPPIGGALIALSGVTQIMSGILWIFGLGFGIGYQEPDGWEMPVMIGAVSVIVGAYATLVAPLTMTRRRLVLSLTAALAAFGTAGVVTMYVISATAVSTGLAGLLLVALSREEFID